MGVLLPPGFNSSACRHSSESCAVAGGAIWTRGKQPTRAITSCDAPQVPVQFSAPELPPVALVALPTLLPLQGPTHFDGDARDLPARALAPPERPPRA